jgi:hypothetical protein
LKKRIRKRVTNSTSMNSSNHQTRKKKRSNLTKKKKSQKTALKSKISSNFPNSLWTRKNPAKNPMLTQTMV